MDDEKPRTEDEHEQEELYELQEEEETSQRRQRLNADFLLDKVIPDEIDWRDLVRRHPMLSVGVAAGLGFLIGRSKGATIVAGASAAVSAAVMRQLSDVLDGEVFEF
ncbi:MAG: DUF883 C-terminal domain-containing protein [Thermoanaerobaculaceae bacterium]|nr:DUF883 C-terminal domain-containing protein [Thermoanaerobaculaceae bacterium]